MNLNEVEINTKYTIETIVGDTEFKQYLSSLGLFTGAKIVVRQRLSSGLVVQVLDTHLAIDKSMASKIVLNLCSAKD